MPSVYTAQTLSTDEQAPFLALQNPDVFSPLNSYPDADQHLGICDNGKPIAYLQIQCQYEIEALAVLSLFFSPEIDFATFTVFLTEELIALTKQKMVLTPVLILSDEQIASPFYQGLQKIGWSDPELFKLQCSFDARIFNPKWLRYSYDLPADTELFLWEERKPQEEERLRRRLEGGNIPFFISPFKNSRTFAAVNSLALRRNAEIIGWMITHHILPDTLSYSCYYVEKEFESQGYAMLLLAEAIKRQKASPIPWALSECNTFQVDSRLLRFYERALIPYTNKNQSLYRCWIN